jgi:hypothetical protein
MILQRLATSIRKQDWFTVLIETLIVVFGVFIGLQVNNWNADRGLRAQEAGILANIREDLASDERQLAEGVASANRNTQAANYALTAAGREVADGVFFATMSSDQVQEDFSVPAQKDFDTRLDSRLWSISVVRYHPTQSSSAFDALMASGNLGLIRDAELVAALQQYQRRWWDIEVSQNSTLRPFRDHTVFVGQKFGLSPFSEMPAEDFIALVGDNKELEAALRTMAEYSLIHRELLAETLKANAALQARLKAPAQ